MLNRRVVMEAYQEIWCQHLQTEELHLACCQISLQQNKYIQSVYQEHSIIIIVSRL